MSFKFSASIAAMAMVIAPLGVAFAQQTSDLPAVNALPGQCFSRVLIPETYETVSEQVIDTPERTEIKVIPATYQTVTERVLVKEESVTRRWIPATFRTVTETIEVEPQRVEQIAVPQTVESYSE